MFRQADGFAERVEAHERTAYIVSGRQCFPGRSILARAEGYQAMPTNPCRAASRLECGSDHFDQAVLSLLMASPCVNCG